MSLSVVLREGETQVTKPQASSDSFSVLHSTLWLKRNVKNDVEWTEKADIKKIDSFAVGEA